MHAHIHKSTKQKKTQQRDWGSNSEVLIRPSNSDVSARKFERDFAEEQLCGKCIIASVVCVLCVRVCVCCVCVTCTYSGVDMHPSIRTYIYSCKRLCMWRSGTSWYVTKMFQTQTSMSKHPTL